MSLETRFCEVCLKEVPLTEFTIHKKTGPALHCKKCQASLAKLYRQDPKKYYEDLEVRRLARKARKEAGITEKPCTKCGITKPLSDYRERSRGVCNRNAVCKECEHDEYKRYRASRKSELSAKAKKAWKEKPQTPEQKEKAKKRASEWYYNNKERAAASMKRNAMIRPPYLRRKILMNQVECTLTTEQWQEILEIFGHRCAYCLRSDVPLTQDHIQPVSKFGPHTAENVVPACRSCNSAKGNRSIFTMLNRGF